MATSSSFLATPLSNFGHQAQTWSAMATRRRLQSCGKALGRLRVCDSWCPPRCLKFYSSPRPVFFFRASSSFFFDSRALPPLSPFLSVSISPSCCGLCCDGIASRPPCRPPRFSFPAASCAAPCCSVEFISAAVRPPPRLSPGPRPSALRAAVCPPCHRPTPFRRGFSSSAFGCSTFFGGRRILPSNMKDVEFAPPKPPAAPAQIWHTKWPAQTAAALGGRYFFRSAANHKPRKINAPTTAPVRTR
eukprot:GHVT01082910.1.p1 GENE.GHVT01082910.1~~GHVT01082910.1.p1  ORF type:complete len:246 (+),score=54.74 GHVT01082910.1:684-1421(+)